MNRKLFLKYIFMYIPFVTGVVLFSFGIINIISSLLLFLGGYVAIKNTFDCRVVRKNVECSNKSNVELKMGCSNSIVCDRTRCKNRVKVRRRVKY